MITDGRYFLTALGTTQLWRYDQRWKRRSVIEPESQVPFRPVEGTQALLLVGAAAPDEVLLSVHIPSSPKLPVATARFHEGNWAFKGDTSAWAMVPEHVLVPWEGKVALIRIADNAEIDLLEDVAEPSALIHVPDSRLIVLAGSGAVTVYDPQARHAGVRLKLTQTTGLPVMEFRDGDKELWLSDGPTLMKLETANWTVVDAAESQTEDDEPTPDIINWTLTQDEDRVLILRDGTSDVVIADALSLEPLATFKTKTQAVDVIEDDKGRIFAIDIEGRLPKAKVRREDAPI